MKLPKPKSLPGLFLYGIVLIALLMVVRLLWAVFDLNFEKLATEQGWDSLLANNASTLGRWFMDNLFWLSLSTASVVSFALGAWATLGVMDIDRRWGGQIGARLRAVAPHQPTAKAVEPAKDVAPKVPPALPARTKAETLLSGDQYRQGRLGEKEARPHVSLLLTRDSGVGSSPGSLRVRTLLTLTNQTASALPDCKVIVESVTRSGATEGVGIPLGTADGGKFAIAPQGKKALTLFYRIYRVAPDEPFKINLVSRPMSKPHIDELNDNTSYVFNILADSNTGVVTRATIQIDVGEYENYEVSILGQSSWRQLPTGAEA